MSALRWVALFSGQGAQRTSHARHVAASALRDPWLQALGGAAPDDAALTENRVAQPTLVAWQLDACAAIARHLPAPVLVAGYSIGEIAACAIAGGFAPFDAIAVAEQRARLMDEAAPFPCVLGAILGLSQREVESLCERAGSAIAIRNGPRHFIVGGTRASVEAAIAEAEAAGATRAHPLPVTTPAHTHLLAGAVAPFAAALERIVRAPLRIPMISAIDAARIATREEVIGALSRQLATRLDWAACMDVIAEMQADAVIEIGPGNALARMLAEAQPEVTVRALEDFREPVAAAEWVAAQRRR